ncbi:MAG: DUF2975 domain-containing protein [Weeksellaceae bacterium]|jgi:large-conductance mechanosensitive channel|nr:DUF2975 domain-containing protein [Weeksellaceae bacterium]
MKTQNILFFLKIISWIAFIGYAIVCGSVIFSFVLSFINPEIAKNMYKINPAIFELKEKNTVTFIFGFSLLIALAFMLAYLWFLVIKLFDKLNLKNPFSIETARHLEKTAFHLMGIWVVSLVAKTYLNWQSGDYMQFDFKIGEGNNFLFMAAIVYIISQIFKRGIEMQEENELTV